jgi:hypothetical protein
LRAISNSSSFFMLRLTETIKAGSSSILIEIPASPPSM